MRSLTRHSWLVAACFVFFASLACNDDEAPSASRARCIEARAAMVDLRIAPQAAIASPELRLEFEKHRTNMIRSLGDEFVERCLSQAPSYADCVINASDAAQAHRCDSNSTAAR